MISFFAAFAVIAAQAASPTPRSAAKAETRTIRVAIVGDSLTEGLGVDPEEAYPALLQKRFKQEGLPVEVLNVGTSGSTSASAVSRIRFISGRKPAPDAVMLALGANDGLRGLDAAAMKKNLTEAVVLAQSKGMKVLIAGMKMPTNFPAETRKRFETVFSEVAREKKTSFLPFLLEGVAANPQLNQPDQIHPNPAGHRRIAEHVYPALKKFLGL